jgi:hypothetical protein
MPDDDPETDDARNEAPLERLDRHWTELLQELRVVQTGIQLLTGFLLTLPFQQKFASLGDVDRAIYLAAVSCSITATGFLQAPVAVHRGVFRRHRRKETVQFAHRLAIVGIAFLALAIICVTTLIFGVVVGNTGGTVAGAIAAALLCVLWLVIPLALRMRELR